MPKYFEYVFSAYGIWVVTFAAYFLHLALRSHRARRALEKLSPQTSSQR